MKYELISPFLELTVTKAEGNIFALHNPLSYLAHTFPLSITLALCKRHVDIAFDSDAIPHSFARRARTEYRGATQRDK